MEPDLTDLLLNERDEFPQSLLEAEAQDLHEGPRRADTVSSARPA